MEMSMLCLPIVLSAVFVFVASSLMHMVLPIHKGDYKKMPGEDKVLAELRNGGLTPGVYMFPGMQSMKDCKSPEFLEKYKKGPVGVITVFSTGPTPSMSKNLIQWFLFCLVITTFVGYVCTLLPAGTAYPVVFRWAGTVAILGFAATNLPASIWMGQPWRITLKFIFDGIVYGLVAAGTFGWLWPKAM